jgi:hypothetical protein
MKLDRSPRHLLHDAAFFFGAARAVSGQDVGADQVVERMQERGRKSDGAAVDE